MWPEDRKVGLELFFYHILFGSVPEPQGGTCHISRVKEKSTLHTNKQKKALCYIKKKKKTSETVLF